MKSSSNSSSSTSHVNIKTSSYHKKALAEIKDSLTPFISTYDNKTHKFGDDNKPPPLPPKTYKNKTLVKDGKGEDLILGCKKSPVEFCHQFRPILYYHAGAPSLPNHPRPSHVKEISDQVKEISGQHNLVQNTEFTSKNLLLFTESKLSGSPNKLDAINRNNQEPEVSPIFIKSKNPLVIKSVKSTHVQKPVLQQATCPKNIGDNQNSEIVNAQICNSVKIDQICRNDLRKHCPGVLSGDSSPKIVDAKCKFSTNNSCRADGLKPGKLNRICKYPPKVEVLNGELGEQNIDDESGQLYKAKVIEDSKKSSSASQHLKPGKLNRMCKYPPKVEVLKVELGEKNIGDESRLLHSLKSSSQHFPHTVPKTNKDVFKDQENSNVNQEDQMFFKNDKIEEASAGFEKVYKHPPHSEVPKSTTGTNFDINISKAPTTNILLQDNHTKCQLPKTIYQSFIPRKSSKHKYKIQKHTSQNFKLFLEQNLAKLLKSQKQRQRRRYQLEKEMTKLALNSLTKHQMRQMLYQKESNYIRLQRTKLRKSMFKKIHHLGTGAFGTVSLVRKLDTGGLYAMKILNKQDVLNKNQIGHVVAERDVLAEADNDWVVKLYFSFQDFRNLYLIMEYVPGGDLMGLLVKFEVFQEPFARFYIAELVLAIESVHKIGFIHRDIKPDNVLIDGNGHIKLTDFGLCTEERTHGCNYLEVQLAKTCEPQFSNDDTDNYGVHLVYSLVGTPNYTAPEILQKRGYTKLCDWWSLGVILYEMLVGQPPFAAPTISETQHKLLNWKKHLHIPNKPNISPVSKNLIQRLLSDPGERLGQTVDDIKNHQMFLDLDFDGLRQQPAPYIPKIDFDTDVSNFDAKSGKVSTGGDGDVGRTFYGLFGYTFRRFFDDAPEVLGDFDVDEEGLRRSIYV